MTTHNTGIQWTHFPGYRGETWNPFVGCSKVSAGCANCYAERVAAARLQHLEHYAQVTDGKRWNGTIWDAPNAFDKPLRAKLKRCYFVNSMGDLFHENAPRHLVAEVFGVMMASEVSGRGHLFIALTKRPERMHTLLSDPGFPDEAACAMRYHLGDDNAEAPAWPLRNLILGVSVEDQATADKRLPFLIRTPATYRCVSAEPLLGDLWLTDWLYSAYDRAALNHQMFGWESRAKLDWVIVGGESGPGARPMYLGWVRSIRDQCRAAGTAFFFKQWGGLTAKAGGALLDGELIQEFPDLTE